MLPVSTPVMLQELETLKDIVDKWKERLETQGVPGIDTPLTGNSPQYAHRLDLWLQELVGELRMVSGKAHNLAEVLATTSI